MIATRKCQGCPAELPPNKGPGRERKWCSDQCRKRTLYSRPCPDCGKLMNGSDGIGPNAPVRCLPCNGARSREQSRAWIIASMHEWAEIFGVQPTAADWNQPYCRLYRKRPGDYFDKLIRRYDGTERSWPPQSTVTLNFGSWSAAIAAAGYEPMSPHDSWLGVRGRALRGEENAA